MDRVYLTKEGYEKIRSEFERLKTKERPAVIKSISAAREFGDLSENAEYHAAKEKQLFLEKKIMELQDKLIRSEIMLFNIPLEHNSRQCRSPMMLWNTQRSINLVLSARPSRINCIL